jgi:hypothetical protein
MKSALGPGLYDQAALNATRVEEVSLLEFEEMLIEDVGCVAWDHEINLL